MPPRKSRGIERSGSLTMVLDPACRDTRIENEKITREWWGGSLVHDSLTTREEKVKKNRLLKLLAEAQEQPSLSPLDLLGSSATANEP
jgi:hypothetical protein